jgi:hypothetical protein
MGLRERGCGDMDWSNLAKDREHTPAILNAVINLQEQYSVGDY